MQSPDLKAMQVVKAPAHRNTSFFRSHHDLFPSGNSRSSLLHEPDPSVSNYHHPRNNAPLRAAFNRQDVSSSNGSGFESSNNDHYSLIQQSVGGRIEELFDDGKEGSDWSKLTRRDELLGSGQSTEEELQQSQHQQQSQNHTPSSYDRSQVHSLSRPKEGPAQSLIINGSRSTFESQKPRSFEHSVLPTPSADMGYAPGTIQCKDQSGHDASDGPPPADA